MHLYDAAPQSLYDTVLYDFGTYPTTPEVLIEILDDLIRCHGHAILAMEQSVIVFVL